MTTVASALLDECAGILGDVGHDQWTAAQLLTYLNDAQLQIANTIPWSSVTTASVTLTAAEPKQSAPTGTIRILDVPYNTGTDGSTEGTRITLIDRDTLESYDRSWAASTPATSIKHWMLSDLNPTVFYVYPRPHASTVVQVMMVYDVVPTTIAAEGANISLADHWGPALKEWVLYRARQRSAEYNKFPERAAMHLDSYMKLIGMKGKAELSASARGREPTQ